MCRFLVITLLIVPLLQALSSEPAELETLFENQQYDRISSLLPQYKQSHPNHPTVLFLRAFLHTDSDSAIQLYKTVAHTSPQSKYADHALFRLAQFHFAQKNYESARLLFTTLFKVYDTSIYKDDAQYLYCQCILAQGKVDSAKIFLKAFVQNVSRSPFVDSAILDLEHLGGLSRDRLAQNKEPKPENRYTIQVASFKSKQNAQNAHYRLSRIFSHVELGERVLGNTRYYIVFVGNFSDKQKAERYANLYIKPYLKEYKIVPTS